MKIFLLKKILKSYLSPFIQKKVYKKISIPKNLKQAAFIFGITDFEYRFQRWQHLSFNLSDWIPVFYINSSFIVKGKLKGEDNFYIKKIHKENLFEINLISDLDYFIYQMSPTKKGRELIVSAIKDILNKAKVSKYIFIITHPFWHFLKDYFDKKRIIYDCLDDHSGFKENRKDINLLEKKLVEGINTVVVTSRQLKDKILEYNFKGKIFVIENAVDEKLVQNIEIVKQRRSLKTFGYIGEINWWFDEDFLEDLLKASFKPKVILVGRVNNKKILSLSKKYSNLQLIGEIEYKKIPFWLQKFDVGLIPFKKNPFTDAVNPVKLYEYFAFGLPVISSSLDNLKRFKNLVYFYDNEDLKEVLKSIKEEHFDKKRKRIQIAKENTWKKRALEYFNLIKSKL